MNETAMRHPLHRIRGGIDVALDIIGRCVVAYRPDGSEMDATILEGLCVAARELGLVAEAVDGELERRVPAGAYGSKR